MSGPQLIGWCLVYAGVTVMVLSALAAAALPEVFERLHLLTATTSLGAPLIGAGLVIIRGWSEASAMIVLVTASVVVTAPVMSAATARLAAQRAGLIDEDLDKGSDEDTP